MIYACAGNAGRSVRHNRHTQKIDGIWGFDHGYVIRGLKILIKIHSN